MAAGIGYQFATIHIQSLLAKEVWLGSLPAGQG